MKRIQEWVDESYGAKGFKVWIIFISWVGLLYILFFLFGDAFTSFFIEKEATFPLGIYLMLVLIYTGLFAGGGLFIFQCKKTAQKINTNDMVNYDVSLYLWGRVLFSNEDISNVEVHNLKGFKKFITPFELEHKNYRVNLNNGNYFYISGLLNNAKSFVKAISFE